MTTRQEYNELEKRREQLVEKLQKHYTKAHSVGRQIYKVDVEIDKVFKKLKNEINASTITSTRNKSSE